MRARFALFVYLAFLSSFLYAETPIEPVEVSSAALQILETPRIGRILINRKNVFESGLPVEQKFPYSWANAFHIVTKESFIRREILFKEGDRLDIESLVESERILRRRPIFRYVRITSQETINGVADVLIETEDVWTTSLTLSYGTAGGKNFYRLGILEQNFLGKGRRLGAFIRQDIDRLVKGVSFRDPHFLGTRWEFNSGYGRDQKGKEWTVALQKDYFSASTPHSEGASLLVRDDEDRIFRDGNEIAKFQHHTEDLRVFASKAIRPNPDRVRRVVVAHERKEDEFSSINGDPMLFEAPVSRTISSGLLGFDYQNVNFVKRNGVLTFDRDEDINRGWEWFIEAGPSLKKFGSTRDGAVARTNIKKTFTFWGDHIWFNHMDVNGRHEDDRIENGILKFRTQYFITDWIDNNTASLRGEFVTSKNLDAEDQFILGGENGLRGYSVRQFSGTKKALFTLENREALWLDWLELINIGWAAFMDTGGVWQDHESPNFKDFKTDLGVGIRFSPSRSVDPGLIRFDVAYALQDNDRSSRFSVNIGADLSFGEKRTSKYDQK